MVIYLKKNNINKIYFITLILFLIDFATKKIIVQKMDLLKSFEIIPNFFYITYVQNNGAAWSILKGNTILLSIVSLVAFIAVGNYMKKVRNLNIKSIIAFAFVLSGILGNFVDRVCYGYVVDFLDFKLFGYDYPVFNLADIMIVVGIVMLIVLMVRGEVDADNSKEGISKNRSVS